MGAKALVRRLRGSGVATSRTRGDAPLMGVVLGVDTGVTPPANEDAGRFNWALSKFSFSSGTVFFFLNEEKRWASTNLRSTIRQAEVTVFPKEL